MAPLFSQAHSIQQANDQIKSYKEYTCFQEYYFSKADLPWELDHKESLGINMLIKKSENGFLFAQQVPDCQKRVSCGYWIRSLTYNGSFFSGPLETVVCPKDLNKKIILELIKTYYSDAFNIKVIQN